MKSKQPKPQPKPYFQPQPNPQSQSQPKSQSQPPPKPQFQSQPQHPPQSPQNKRQSSDESGKSEKRLVILRSIYKDVQLPAKYRNELSVSTQPEAGTSTDIVVNLASGIKYCQSIYNNFLMILRSYLLCFI